MASPSASQTDPLGRTSSPLAAAQGTAPGSATALGTLTRAPATALEGSMQEPYQPKLSKHEKQLMQQAHERHQASITSKQV